MHRAQVITGHMEAFAVELADPAFDRNLPVGVAIEEGADDADADRLARRRWWRQGRGRILPPDDARYHFAVDLLQRAVVAALIGQQKRMPGTAGLHRIALQHAGLRILAKRA